MTVSPRPLGPDEAEAMLQLFLRGPTWDGDLVSKAGRTGLVDLGYAERCNGWQQLTSRGFEVAVRSGLGDEKEHVDSKRRRASRDEHAVIREALRRLGGAITCTVEGNDGNIKIERNGDGGLTCRFDASKS
jgi:hypothetical protein